MDNEYIILSDINKRQVLVRRIVLFGLVLISVIFATIKWALFIPSDLNLIIRYGLIFLFCATFGWISLYFFSSVFGFFELLRRRKMPGIKRVSLDKKLTTKTAILMPVYNESPLNVYANLLAMAKDLEKTGQETAFDFFVLSDTTKPDVWVQEEALWLEVKKKFPKNISIYYRHRPKNTARKSGNIEDFCVRWGRHYDFMIVLDADSLMTGSTVVQMAQLMEVNTTTGIIQAPPMIINTNSWFARVQQFAGRVYGPIVSAGLAYWQVWDSNYWGHNAIIRVKAFIESCGLPVFPGQAPFGGHILSHDFVEAALIRRDGWLAWMLPELKGSYEECPPSMIDFAVRDRRWCQGNLQHLRILFSKKLHPVSRIHFTMGIMSYLSSPLWFLFLLFGLGIALWREFFPPEYFSDTKTLFPSWPVFDFFGTLMLFALSMGMLFLPKILGFLIVLIQTPKKKTYGGYLGLFKTFVVETIFSALTAPIMMLFQTKIVFDILMGFDAGWSSQNRDTNGTSWKEAFKRHCVHTVLGVATTVIVYLYANSLFYWILPITIGLILSIPISVFSSRETTGLWAKRKNLFLIPEEYKKPTILRMAEEAFAELLQVAPTEKGLQLLLKNPVYRALHVYMLSVNAPAPEFSADVEKSAIKKLQSFVNCEQLELSQEEIKFCLYHPYLLEEMALLTA